MIGRNDGKGKAVDEMWSDFTKILYELVKMHIPLKRERKKKRRLSKQKISERSRAWQKYCQYRSGKNFDKYKQLRNEVNQAIRREEDEHRKRILSGFKHNRKRFFGYMRSQQTVKDNLTTLRKLNGELTTTDQETADLLSTYFQEVYTVEDTSNLPVVKISNFSWNDAELNFDT